MNLQDKYDYFKEFYLIFRAKVNEYTFVDKDKIKNNES